MSRNERMLTVVGFFVAFLVVVGIMFLVMSPRARSADDTRWDVIGGTFGHRGTGWHLIDDGHSHKHVGEPSCRGRYLSVPHTRGVKVPIWSVDTDEHLRAWDISASVSATKSEARVFFDIDGRPISCWHRAFRESLANVWLDGDIELEAAP